MELHIIILAAGKGVRMNSVLPKALQPVGGKPMLQYVLQTAQKMHPQKIHIVYSNSLEKFCEAIPATELENLNWVQQKEAKGTGHAVQQALPFIPNKAQVLILYGDVPLITTPTLQKLVKKTPRENLGILVTKLQNPTGFGRILRNAKGAVSAIIEEKDADKNQRAICEINTGIMLAPASLLKKCLAKVKPENVQKEYYLTDVIALAVQQGTTISGSLTENSDEVMGANDKLQLAFLERYYQKNQAKKVMRQGVTLFDPARFDLRGELKAGQDVSIDINVILEGKVTLGDNTQIGANCILRDARIGKNVMVKPNSIIEDSIIEDDCIVGPFARIRPKSLLKAKARVGNFVEVKKTIIGKASKANHLTYLGDSIIGDDVNVGAGTITCNYDGVNKYQTIIESGAFIGSCTQFIAPVKIGKNATIGAGSTITANTPAGKLTLARARQVTIDHWLGPTKNPLKKPKQN